MSNKTSFTIELTEEELDIFRDLFTCQEVQLRLKEYGRHSPPGFCSTIDKICEAVKLPEPEKPVSLDDYFSF